MTDEEETVERASFIRETDELLERFLRRRRFHLYGSSFPGGGLLEGQIDELLCASYRRTQSNLVRDRPGRYSGSRPFAPFCIEGKPADRRDELCSLFV